MNTFRNLRLAVRLDIAALERVSDLGERSESIAHKTAQHLYVYDGDLKAEDTLQKEIEALDARSDEDAEALTKLIRTAHPESLPTLEEYNAAHEAYVGQWSKALEHSRQETVDAVEERDGSRAIYSDGVLAALADMEEISEALEDEIRHTARAPTRSAGSRPRSTRCWARRRPAWAPTT
jgi:hypothetical protein